VIRGLLPFHIVLLCLSSSLLPITNKPFLLVTITSSSIPGKGMKQSDDLMHNYTVAKARESITFSSPTEVKQIACTYHCG